MNKQRPRSHAASPPRIFIQARTLPLAWTTGEWLYSTWQMKHANKELPVFSFYFRWKLWSFLGRESSFFRCCRQRLRLLCKTPSPASCWRYRRWGCMRVKSIERTHGRNVCEHEPLITGINECALYLLFRFCINVCPYWLQLRYMHHFQKGGFWNSALCAHHLLFPLTPTMIGN